MDTTELVRLQKGQKLLGKIEKLKAQIETLNNVTHIQLSTHKEKKGNQISYYPNELIERVVDFDIPLNIRDKEPHPFAHDSCLFVNKLSLFLQEQVKQLQKEFNEL